MKLRTSRSGVGRRSERVGNNVVDYIVMAATWWQKKRSNEAKPLLQQLTIEPWKYPVNSHLATMVSKDALIFTAGLENFRYFKAGNNLWFNLHYLFPIRIWIEKLHFHRYQPTFPYRSRTKNFRREWHAASKAKRETSESPFRFVFSTATKTFSILIEP